MCVCVFAPVRVRPRGVALRSGPPVANAGGLGPWGTGLARWAGWMLALSALALAVLYGVDRQLGVLAATLARIDLLAFGGGFAAVPLMQHEVVAVRGWMSAPAFIDGIALGQVTPGPIVITATFVGYAVRGVAGALVATVAAFAPSFIVLTAALSCYRRWGWRSCCAQRPRSRRRRRRSPGCGKRFGPSTSSSRPMPTIGPRSS